MCVKYFCHKEAFIIIKRVFIINNIVVKVVILYTLVCFILIEK